MVQDSEVLCAGGPPQGFAGVAELAQRLGVEPYRPPMVATSSSPVLCVPGDDGRVYPLLDLVSAVLDRLEEGTEAADSVLSAIERARAARAAKGSSKAH